MTRRAILVFLIIVILALIFAAGAGAEEVEGVRFEGPEMVVTLEESPTTGYIWSFVTVPDGLLTCVDDVYIPDKNSIDADGAGGLRQFTFRANKAGFVGLRLTLPFQGDPESVNRELAYAVLMSDCPDLLIISVDEWDTQLLEAIFSDVPLKDKDITSIRPGQTVYAALRENQSTPYRWEYVISDETVLTLVEDEYKPDSNPKMLPGVGGMHWYNFIALNAGICTVEMRLMQIGAEGEDAVEQMIYTVLVE